MKTVSGCGLLILFLTGVLSFAGCHAAEMETVEETKNKTPVEVHICRSVPYRPVIRGFGTIEPIRKAEILPPLTETVVEMCCLEGDLVKKGELLAQLDTRAMTLQLQEQISVRQGCLAALKVAEENYRKALRDREARFFSIQSAEAECRKTRAEFSRMKEVLEQKRKLYQLDGITQEELESAEMALMEKQTVLDQAMFNLGSLRIGFRIEDLVAAGMLSPDKEEMEEDILKALFLDLNTRKESAECDLAAAELAEAERRIASLELRINECSIRSPLDGIVGRRYRDDGEKVSPDSPLYTIYTANPVHALISLSEKDLLRVSPGMKAEVICDADGQKFSGTVDRVSPWISSETRSGELRVMLDSGSFRIGQFVLAELALKEESSRILIPSSAILEDGDPVLSEIEADVRFHRSEASVFVLKDDRIFRKALTVGIPEAEGIPVIQGLDDGDEIVLSPAGQFRDGMEIIRK